MILFFFQKLPQIFNGIKIGALGRRVDNFTASLLDSGDAQHRFLGHVLTQMLFKCFWVIEISKPKNNRAYGLLPRHHFIKGPSPPIPLEEAHP